MSDNPRKRRGCSGEDRDAHLFNLGEFDRRVRQNTESLQRLDRDIFARVVREALIALDVVARKSQPGSAFKGSLPAMSCTH